MYKLSNNVLIAYINMQLGEKTNTGWVAYVFVYSMSVCVCMCRVDEVLVTEVESLIALQCVGWSWSRCAILPKRTIGGRTEGPLRTTSVSSLCHMHLIHTLLHTMSDIYTYTALINTSSSVSTSAAFLSQPILIT